MFPDPNDPFISSERQSTKTNPTYRKFPLNIIAMRRYSVNKHPKDSLRTPNGIMPLNYYLEHHPPYQENSSRSHNWRSENRKSLWTNIWKEEPSVHPTPHLHTKHSMSRRKTEN